MDNVTSDTILKRLQDIVRTETQPLDALVPVDDFAVYYLLASEIARTAANEGGEDLIVLLDNLTAAQVDAVDAFHVTAGRIFVFGNPPESWNTANNLTICQARPSANCTDLFLIVMSPRLTMSLVCEQGQAAFRGGWTAEREHAATIAKSMLEEAGHFGDDEKLAMEKAAEPDDCSLTCATRLMALLARQLNLRQRDIAMDKDDLFGVLNILKAISAKRRAHDILYVFVEQIARAVKMDRCSVVRVWGGDDRVHVLASHEDENISDLIVSLHKYPEIKKAMETRQKVIINDTQHDPLTKPFMKEMAKAGIRSLIVIPVVLFDQNVGSFLLRAARSQGSFSLREISFCEIVAEAAANALERAHLFESIQKANERLEYLAVTDGLTGLYNHRFFRQRLEDEFERARRYDLPLSCLIMDIDNFKMVNDTYGHLQGDTILRGIASCSLQTVRKSDIVARYGGEEFVVIMPQTGIEGATAQAERIRREIAQCHFEGMPENHHVTVSVGVAIFDSATMLDCEALMRVADAALYTAKKEGKNRIVVGQP